MPGPGTTGAISGFMQGWMEGSARQREEKMKRATGLMDIATKMANLIDNSDSPEERAVYHKTMMDSMTESQKLMKGGSEWGFITKLFGGKGKKDQLQDPHAILSGLGADISPYGTQEKPMAVQQSPGLATAIAPQQAATPSTDQAGGVSSMISQSQEANLPGQAKPVTMNVPMPRKATPGAVAPDEVTGKGLEKVQLGPGQFDYRIGGLAVAPRDYRAAILRTSQADFEDERASARAEEAANRAMEHQKEWVTWQTEQTDRYNFSRAEKWGKTSPAQDLQKKDPQLYQDTMQFLQFGVPVRDRSYTLREIDSQPNPVTGRRMRQLYSIDARSGSVHAKIGDAEEIPPTPHDLAVRPFMTEGRTFSQAESVWAKSEMSDNQLSMRLKQLQAERSEEMITATQQLNKLRQQKLEGKADQAWAKQILAIARPLAKAAGQKYNPQTGMITMDVDASMAALIQIVQFYGNIDWSEFQTLLGKPAAAGGAPSGDEDNALWFLKQHQNPGSNTPGITGAIGGKGGQAPAGKPLTLPGKQP